MYHEDKLRIKLLLRSTDFKFFCVLFQNVLLHSTSLIHITFWYFQSGYKLIIIHVTNPCTRFFDLNLENGSSRSIITSIIILTRYMWSENRDAGFHLLSLGQYSVHNIFRILYLFFLVKDLREDISYFYSLRLNLFSLIWYQTQVESKKKISISSFVSSDFSWPNFNCCTLITLLQLKWKLSTINLLVSLD